MPHVLIDKLNQIWPADQWRDTTVVVAVSGGADSVALLRALESTFRQVPGPGQLIAAHFNHRLRGAESDQDEAFVANLCRELRIPLQSGQSLAAAASEDQEDQDQTSFTESDPDLWDGEAQARDLRYAFLRQVVAQCGARYLATAHHADDQVETVLHRIIRGTGIQGLAGIPPARELLPGVSLIRPLLNVWKAEIIHFLTELQQPYRSDSSNVSTRFTRNKLRHELLPLIEREFNPRSKDALFRLATIAQDVSTVIQQRVDQLLVSSLRETAKREIQIECSSLNGVEPFLIRELLARIWQQQKWPQREMTQEKWNKLVEMTGMAGVDKKMMLPGEITAQRSVNYLSLRERWEGTSR
jgi:tRNA(Ile)-lysidine synthase